MKNMLKLGLSLAAFASVACVLLAVVSLLTAPAIAAAKEAEVNKGLAVVFSGAQSFEQAPGFVPDAATSVNIENLYLAKNDGEVIGAVVQATGPTYDKATVLIGVDLNRTITGITFLSISDTPGFGQRATEPAFYTQFAGKSADDKFVVGTDVDAISGATITSKGVAQIIKYAAYIAGEYLAQNYGGASGSGEAPVITAPAQTFTYQEAYLSIFPPEIYPDATFTEISRDISRIVRNMIVEKQVIVTVAGKTAGAMVAVRGQTYKKGGIVLTAVDMNRMILGVRIIELEDTPNIGQQALEESFYGQFYGKSADAPLLIDDGFDAISGATITSACVADMVKVGAMEAAWVATSRGGKTAPAGSDEYTLNERYLEE